MFRNRRFACLILGIWLGAAVSVDLAVTQNFSTVDRFIAAPGSAFVAALIKQEGVQSLRAILRRNAAEENAWIFEIWEWAQILIAVVFFPLILFGERPPRSALILVPLMLAIVLLQRFVLTPHVASLGRAIDDIPPKDLPDNPMVARFWVFHGFYSGGEILKLLLGVGVAARLTTRRTQEIKPNQVRAHQNG